MYTNRMRILISLIIVIVLGLAAAFIYAHAPRLAFVAPVATTTAATSTSAQMTVKTINESTSVYTINARYPQFGIPAVDQAIKSDLDKALADFKSLPANPPDSAVTQNEFNSDVVSTYVGSDAVSVALEMSQYTGGAHPMTVIDGINIDPSTGKKITLDDALAMIGKTLPEVASSTLDQLKEKLNGSVFEEGAQPTPENYQTFLIDANSVTFVFQEYQVAAYAAGIQRITFARGSSSTR